MDLPLYAGFSAVVWLNGSGKKVAHEGMTAACSGEVWT